MFDVKCPECKSNYIYPNASIDIWSDDFKMFTCGACGEQFNTKEENVEQAVRTLVNLNSSDKKLCEAIQTIGLAILDESEKEDSDGSLQDWVANKDYNGDETLEQLVKERDEVR